MKNVRFWLFLGLCVPCVAFGATGSDFQNATQLLSAARRGDTRTMQFLINSGADINYVDSTGLSLVCTAIMNNDKRAIQILQMYGADASDCDKQIKQYKQKTKVAAQGEEYDFFSGLSSSHIVVLSAIGVAAVVGGIALLTNAFDSKNNNDVSSSGGSHSPDGGGGGSSSVSADFTIPYGPAYLNSSGEVNKSFDIKTNLALYDSTDGIFKTDFDYLRTASGFVSAGLNPMLENYLLDMGGYYSFASGYKGQNIFRDKKTNAPLRAEKEDVDGQPVQGRPVRVALITGDGINPAGSADSAKGITYSDGTGLAASSYHVDKYMNNKATDVVDDTGVTVSYVLSEYPGYDFSGSGSVFNPLVDVNDSALAKIVAGWEADGVRSSAVGDLYGFVPNGQLAIYRTGNGKIWVNVSSLGDSVGTLTNNDTNASLSAGDVIKINDVEYSVKSALGETTEINPTLFFKVGEATKTYQLASTSKLFIATCPDSATDCTDLALYIGTDGYWYVYKLDGSSDIDFVYSVDSSNKIYVQKNSESFGYANFSAMAAAKSDVDVIANTNVIPNSRDNNYVTVDNFVKAAGNADLNTAYQAFITNYYGVVNKTEQGTKANNLFLSYTGTSPLIIMPAGDYLYIHKENTGTTETPVWQTTTYYDTLAATFENYAPMLYNDTLKHNFMTVVGVRHENGTAGAETITGYGDGTGSEYGRLRLSIWYDNFASEANSANLYSSRMCGLAGVGDSANGIDPWCFAASGPTAEMAAASAAGAVASVKSAFANMNSMSNDQIFTLLALTADGPYLKTDKSIDGKVTNFTTDTLVSYLKSMYEIPADLIPLGEDSLSSSEYLDIFKRVYGYGLINLRRAITPGFSVYYYNGTSGQIVASDGSNNQYWGNEARASSVLSFGGRKSITTSFYDIVESLDGSVSLPRVWKKTLSLNSVDNRHGLYMGDVLGDFNVDSTNKQSNQVGNFTVAMSMSQRAYNDNLNGLDEMRIAWTNDRFDLDAGYQRYLTDGESRFNGRSNGVLDLVADSVSATTMYKNGRFGFGGRAFVGAITDENLLDTDPVVSSQYEPGRLGLANGGSFDAKYMYDKFGLNVSFGVMRENNTVLGMVSDGIFAMNNADTKYIDTVATYKPFDNVKLSLRGTFATTRVDNQSEFISQLSDIKSNAFAFGTDIGGFSFTVALPLAVTNGSIGYGDADFEVVENNGKYEIMVNNPHIEYIDLSAQKRELRFSTSYKHALGEFTDAGVGLIYRVNPNNTDAFGNESVLMFKLHHRLGI